MKKIGLMNTLFIGFILIFSGCGSQEKQDAPSDTAGPTDEAVEVNISAASSLTDALTEIQKEYAKESNAVLRFNFGRIRSAAKSDRGRRALRFIHFCI